MAQWTGENEFPSISLKMFFSRRYSTQLAWPTRRNFINNKSKTVKSSTYHCNMPSARPYTADYPWPSSPPRSYMSRSSACRRNDHRQRRGATQSYRWHPWHSPSCYLTTTTGLCCSVHSPPKTKRFWIQDNGESWRYLTALKRQECSSVSTMLGSAPHFSRVWTHSMWFPDTASIKAVLCWLKQRQIQLFFNRAVHKIAKKFTSELKL